MTRDLHAFFSGTEIAPGARLRLTAEETSGLRPDLHTLTVFGLEEVDLYSLFSGIEVQVVSDSRILASGAAVDFARRMEDGQSVVDVTFSPGLALWEAPISLSLPAGETVSSSMAAVLEATGLNIPLASFTAEDLTISRPQAFFGRAAEALENLAASVSGLLSLSSAGVSVSSDTTPSLVLEEDDLTSAPRRAGGNLLLCCPVAPWSVGNVLKYTWSGIERRGRILSSLIEADSETGPWSAMVELEQII